MKEKASRKRWHFSWGSSEKQDWIYWDGEGKDGIWRRKNRSLNRHQEKLKPNPGSVTSLV